MAKNARYASSVFGKSVSTASRSGVTTLIFMLSMSCGFIRLMTNSLSSRVKSAFNSAVTSRAFSIVSRSPRASALSLW